MEREKTPTTSPIKSSGLDQKSIYVGFGSVPIFIIDYHPKISCAGYYALVKLNKGCHKKFWTSQIRYNKKYLLTGLPTLP